jgi:mRNA-degrading endonuclease RelE of RelBE toxin-antitoxin system
VYSILLERSAEKDLGRLAHDLHDRIIAAIQKLAQNPGHRAAGN